jgi:uncharacterized protein (TIGR00106 family)
MAIVEVSIVPLGVREKSLSSHVARVLKVVENSNVSYELTAMGTILSGNLDDIWSVLRKMHEACFEGEVPRVLTHVKIDDRRDIQATPEQKVQSVLKKLS